MDFKLFIWFISCLALGAPQDPSKKKNLLAGNRFCGFQHADDFNRKDNVTAITEFPWIARLKYSDAKYPDPVLFICIGTLINSRYILTAARCCTFENLTLRQVLLGEFNFFQQKDCVMETSLQECSDPVQTYNVEKTVVHPKYSGVYYENNVALIRLEKTVRFSDYIRPICLPSPDSDTMKTGDVLTSCGWHNDVEKGDLKTCAVGKVMSFEDCESMYSRNHRIQLNENNICTTKVNDMDMDITCAADLGAAAALSRRRKQWYQETIIVPGFTRCKADFPVIFMKVSNYYDWIVDSLEP